MPGTITREQFLELMLDELCDSLQTIHRCQGCPFKRDMGVVTGHSRDRWCSLEIVKSAIEPVFKEE